MNCEIICIGTEILLGDIVNTNSQYISRELANLGINVFYQTAIGDNASRLKKSIIEAFDRSDLIITTGGLGPTQDDLTKETIAETLGMKMELHQESLDRMQLFFNNISCKMTKNNIKQAYIPKGAHVISNNNGTAPGILIEKENKTIVMLPGPPREMIPMLDNHVVPYLRDKSKIKFYSRYYKISGVGESALEDILIDIIDKQTNPTIATYAKLGEVLLRVTANGDTKEEATKILNTYETIIKDRLGEFIYSDKNESLEDVVGQLLIENNLKISIAESCTGGLISSRLTKIPGISTSLHSCIVSYSNEAKEKMIGVNCRTLRKFGAVSRETAEEMCIKLHEKTNTDIVIATTGIAGPSGATETKPVGLVYIAIYYKGKLIVEKYNISGDRLRIQQKASNLALNLIRKHIKNDLTITTK